MSDLLALHGLNFLYIALTLALIALGLAIVFGLLGVMNMAHGEFVMLGAYSVLVVQDAGLPFLTAIPVALVTCAIVGWLLEWIVIRHLYSRPFDTLLATWGLAILMREVIEAVFGRDYKSIDQALPGTVQLLGVDYPAYRVILMVLMIVFFAVLLLWYGRSNTGARIKAMVGNPDLATAVGINTSVLARRAFIFGVCMAGFAGVALAPLVRVEPYMGLDYLLSSFFILVVGGLGSLTGLLVGSTVIGGSDAIVSALTSKTGGYMTVLIISILFLWLRPNGIVTRN